MDSDSIMRRFESYWGNHAEIAQLVEQLPRKEQVVGSSPIFSTISKLFELFELLDRYQSEMIDFFIKNVQIVL